MLWTALVVALIAQCVGLYSDGAPGPPPTIPHLDKLAHLLSFAIPTALATWLRARWLVWAFAGHAVVSEFLQSWLTSARIFDPWDMVANLTGVLVGAWCASVLRSRWAMMSR